MKKIFNLFVFLICFLSVNLSAFSEDIFSELTNLRAEKDFLLIDVAKKYPKVVISQYENPPKILIELLDSKYHKNFKSELIDKKSFLENLSFLTDISFGVVSYENNKSKVSIVLKLKEDTKLLPKLFSTKDNIVKISFLQPVDSEKPKAPPKNNILELYNQAVEEHTKGNFDKAEMLYKEVLSKDESFYLARFNLAKIYLDKDRYDDSISILLSVIEDLKKLPTELQDKKNLTFVNNTLGTVYYLKGNYDEAKEQFDEVIKVDPDFYQPYYNIGLIYEKKKDLKEAKTNLQKAIELKPDLAEAYYHLAVLNLITNDKKEAVFNFKKVVELTPDTRIGKLSQAELEKLEKRKFKFFHHHK